ncbi:hypothetical protein CLV63_103186 [Murinocardiopsis flavida]|uniref:DUF1611 domain-containing protein n=1 Tax=Murinocardiopsis flavida TaxID=645275 RepID=A0A2P8DQH5_9ACTN|nr:DUF1611 domain-containing protein [Murinocardiopsis flavida]PSK99461.1 hypothetical protein CLV63_103186 [Murinocardiopsis flavida]
MTAPTVCQPTALTEFQRAALKVSYTVRALDVDRPTHLLSGPDIRPNPGDVVAAEVTEVGRHTRVELANGRRAHLFPGDVLLLAYAARYAPDQFEAELPLDLGPCHLVAAGGIAAEVRTAHDAMAAPTRITPIGIAATAAGTRVTMEGLAAPTPARPMRGVPTIAVVGTAMNAGKTSTGAALVRGLTAAGYRVGAAKITGTGAGGDRWLFADSGAAGVLDFTDAGMATTYRMPLDRIMEGARDLRDRLVLDGADAVVLEIADGVMQPETARLLARDDFQAMVGSCVFAAGDAPGALYGVDRLRAIGLPVVAVSGRLTASPLAIREVAGVLDVGVHGLTGLADPEVAVRLLRPAVEPAGYFHDAGDALRLAGEPVAAAQGASERSA